jgi:hypothetical protein
LRVLPWEPLLRPDRAARLHTDVIVIDSFTHLLGCWGLDELADRGDVIFPLNLEELQVFGERPAVGTDVACRIAIEDLQRHRVRVRAEIVRPDGTVWMRLDGWEDWRFHWPGRYRDVFRQPRDTFVGEELLPGDREASVVWLAPPADMGRPVWRDVLEQTQLGPAERAEHLARGEPEDVRSRRLWGRIAAKEAARRLRRAEGRRPTYPADLAVVPDADGRGRPRLIRVDDPGDQTLPAIAIADADGVAVAIAARDPMAHLGIAVAVIPAHTGGLEQAALTPSERALLGRWSGPTSLEWAARFACAREAAARAVGTGLDGGTRPAEIIDADEVTGDVRVRLASTTDVPLRVASARRGEYAWAWALAGGGVQP